MELNAQIFHLGGCQQSFVSRRTEESSDFTDCVSGARMSWDKSAKFDMMLILRDSFTMQAFVLSYGDRVDSIRSTNWSGDECQHPYFVTLRPFFFPASCFLANIRNNLFSWESSGMSDKMSSSWIFPCNRNKCHLPLPRYFKLEEVQGRIQYIYICFGNWKCNHLKKRPGFWTFFCFIITCNRKKKKTCVCVSILKPK